jgi:hypothetical protein
MVDMAVSETTRTERSGEAEPRPRLPYQALFAIAAALLVLAIVLAILALNRDTSSGTQTVPPVTTPSAAPPTNGTTTSSSPAPSSANDKAAADATAAYVAYVAARNQLGRDGGAKESEAKVLKMTTKDGTERPYIKGYAKRLRDRDLRLISGSSTAVSRVNAIELGDKPPQVDLTACLDQRSLRATEKGKPAEVPEFLRYSVVMHLVDGKWLVDQVQNATSDMDPQEVTSCEP